MAPNLGLRERDLIDHPIVDKLQSGDGPTDRQIANLGRTTERTVRRHRSNLCHFRTPKLPSNGVGRPKTMTPNMLSALCDQLARNPCMRQKDMAIFLRRQFEVEVSRFCLGRALKGLRYTKKVTRNVAKERNMDLRADHIHERSFFSSQHLIYVDESGYDRSIGIKNKGWAERGITPVQTKRFHRGQRFQILPAYTQDVLKPLKGPLMPRHLNASSNVFYLDSTSGVECQMFTDALGCFRAVNAHVQETHGE
jgi:transposase